MMVATMVAKWAVSTAWKRVVDSVASKVVMMVADSVELMDN